MHCQPLFAATDFMSGTYASLILGSIACYFLLGIVVWFMCKDHPLWKEIHFIYFPAHAIIAFAAEEMKKGIRDGLIAAFGLPWVVGIIVMIFQAFPILIPFWFFGMPLWLIGKDLFNRERDMRWERKRNAASLAIELDRVRKIPTPAKPVKRKHFVKQLQKEFSQIRNGTKKMGVLDAEDTEEVDAMFADKVLQSIHDYLERMF